VDIVKANSVLYKAANRLMIEENDMLEQNVDPSIEAFDAFLSDTVNGVVSEYRVTDANAWTILNAFLDEMMAAGTIEDIPEDSDSGGLNKWVANAQQVGFIDKLNGWVKKNIEFE